MVWVLGIEEGKGEERGKSKWIYTFRHMDGVSIHVVRGEVYVFLPKK